MRKLLTRSNNRGEVGIKRTVSFLHKGDTTIATEIVAFDKTNTEIVPHVFHSSHLVPETGLTTSNRAGRYFPLALISFLGVFQYTIKDGKVQTAKFQCMIPHQYVQSESAVICRYCDSVEPVSVILEKLLKSRGLTKA